MTDERRVRISHPLGTTEVGISPVRPNSAERVWGATKDRLRREAFWVGAAGAVGVGGAVAHANAGATTWIYLSGATWVVLLHPAVRRALRWRPPRRDGVVRQAVLPARVMESASPRLNAKGLARRFKQDWPSICKEAKWTRGQETPSLLYARAEDTNTLAIGWRPWIDTGEKTWDTLAHVIRRAVAGQTVRWWINPEDSGLMEIRIGLTPLPAKVPLTEPLPPAKTDGTGRFVLGPQAGGGEASWCPLESPHMLVAGSTNYGKGGTLRMILSQATEWNVRVVNPKDSGEFNWLTAFQNAEVVSTRRDSARMLTQVEEHRVRIQALIKQHGADRWSELPADIRPTPYLIVIDEASELLDGDDTETQTAADCLVSLARMGRSAGVHLVIATQRPDVAGGAMGRRGGQLRAQLTARLVVGKIDKAGLSMVLEGRDTDVLAGLPGLPGRALVSGLDAAGGSDVSVVQVAWLPQDAASRAVGARLSGHTLAGVSEVAGSDTGTTPPIGGVVDGGGSDNPDKPDMGVSGRGGAAPDAWGDEGWGTPRGVDAEASDPPEVDEPDPTDDNWRPGDHDVDGRGSDVNGRAVVVPLAVAAERLGVSERTVRRYAADPDHPEVTYRSRGLVAVRQ